MKKIPTKEKQAPEAFVRKTITIPAEVADFAEQQAGRPDHAGNMSSYVRALILRDRQSHDKKQAA